MQGRENRRWLELAFLAAGLATAGAFIGVSTPALIARFQVPATQLANAAQLGPVDGDVIASDVLGTSYAQRSNFALGTRIGTLTIPALRLVAPVIEGVGDSDLRRGVGHVPGSAQSGGLGNVVLAAHRDTIFRPLRQIQKGMELQLAGADGTYRYAVDSMQVVSPDRLEVTEIASEPQVTLITCYPFNFIGSAPMRFIVKAHLMSAMPTGNTN